MVLRGDWVPGRRPEEVRRREEARLAEIKRLQAEADRVQRALNAQIQRAIAAQNERISRLEEERG